MSKLKAKIDGELWERGKLFIHGDSEPEAIINIEGKATDLEDTEIAKSFEQALREHNEHRYKVWWERIKENENAENQG